MTSYKKTKIRLSVASCWLGCALHAQFTRLLVQATRSFQGAVTLQPTSPRPLALGPSRSHRAALESILASQLPHHRPDDGRANMGAGQSQILQNMQQNSNCTRMRTPPPPWPPVD